MIEDAYVPTVESIRAEVEQIDTESTLYSVQGTVDDRMTELREKIDKHLGIVIFHNNPSDPAVMARLMSVQDVLLEKLWALHEEHLPERSPRLFGEDLCLRQGRPLYPPDVENMVRVTPLVDYTLGQSPSRIFLPAGSTVSFDVDGQPPQQTILLAAEGGWRAELAAIDFPRKGLLVGNTGEFDEWVELTMPSISINS